jgi:ZIP family zinc transporter
LAATGWNWRRVVGLWSWVVLACGAASVLGYGAGAISHQLTGARMSAFAGGGILAMLSNSLVPFAHERSKAAGLWTVVGFCASFAMG